MEEEKLNEEKLNEESEVVSSEQTKETNEEKKGFLSAVGNVFKTLGSWIARMFMGASKKLASDQENKKKTDINEVEKIVTPGKQVFLNFFRKPLAVGALVVLVCMFLLIFIGSAVKPLDLSYVEDTQKNMAPGYNLMDVPKGLKNDVKSISSASSFSVGLSNDGKVYVWGDTAVTSIINMKDVPAKIQNGKVAFAAAGTDHAIAIMNNGEIIGWGNNRLKQFGSGPAIDPFTWQETVVNYIPDELTGSLTSASQVKQLACGTQVTAVVLQDGTAYLWGNVESGANNFSISKKFSNVEKVAFTADKMVMLKKDGTIDVGGSTLFKKFYYMENGESKYILKDEFFGSGDKVADIAAASGSAMFLTEQGKIYVAGNADSGEKVIPDFGFTSSSQVKAIGGGLKHYVLITADNKVYAWGSNALGQTDAPSSVGGATQIFVGPFQNYVVNGNGKLVEKWGLKGYLMGTDRFGRDIWTRILHGGKMTMTVGAIAVIISSIIGIIIGCLSGYFGGWVDMLLMRITEIVSAIPFLPFALILSLIVNQLGMTEDARIALIMVVLGLLSWTGLAHLVRGQVLAAREQEFVTAAKAMGVKEGKIAFKHILPNVISIIIVSMTLDFAGCMLTESSLSYLGFGVLPPRPTWGNMLNGANNSIVIQTYWWQWVFPSLFLAIATISINIIGDALRDVMDPKSSSER